MVERLINVEYIHTYIYPNLNINAPNPDYAM